jgi:hypothetical protein
MSPLTSKLRVVDFGVEINGNPTRVVSRLTDIVRFAVDAYSRIDPHIVIG